jgi:hypothetical protein
MEQKLGRCLEPQEVVDHIDGNTLNNAPENLRLFESNAKHLAETLKGKVPNWSEAGRKNFVGRLGKVDQHVDTHGQNKKQRVVQRQRIDRAGVELGQAALDALGTEGYTIETTDSLERRKTRRDQVGLHHKCAYSRKRSQP